MEAILFPSSVIYPAYQVVQLSLGVDMDEKTCPM